MRKISILAASIFFVFLFSFDAANALVISDVFDPAQDVYIKNGFSVFQWFSLNDPYSYQHNILDDGYDPLTDTINSGLITLVMYDDEPDPDLIKDNVKIYFSDNGSGWDYQIQYDVEDFPTSIPIVVDPDDVDDGIIWVGLNAQNQGLSNLLFSSDFYFDKSTLEVDVDRAVMPEPATLALFGTGLLGFGLVKRKK